MKKFILAIFAAFIFAACSDQADMITTPDAGDEDPAINNPTGDEDNDDIQNSVDNCIYVDNTNQADVDGDGVGDVCDDEDEDGVIDTEDNCQDDSNVDQTDIDGDGLGDDCDDDMDGDGLDNDADNCETISNAAQGDNDADNLGDSCDADDDNDGVADVDDDFPTDPTESADPDGDGIGSNTDNCDDDANADQADYDGDGAGDVCDAFPADPSEWIDTDGDGVGDNSDAFPTDPTETVDTDGDGVGDNSDNCLSDANSDQADSNADGEGDVCDTDSDSDGDGIFDADDNCPSIANADQADYDADGTGDVCDTADTDGDGDGYNEGTGDCDDSNATVYTGATELEDGIDNDCDGVVDNDTNVYDDDGDGLTENAGDCDDSSSWIYPEATEIFDLGDSNCDGTGDADFTLANSTAMINGDTDQLQLGKAVAMLGDIDGDGYEDFALVSTNSGSYAGKIYIYYGGTSLSGEVLLSAANLTFTGEAAGDKAGTVVTSAGDINTDGCGDFIVSAPYHSSNTGKVYLILGQGTACGGSRLTGTKNLSTVGTTVRGAVYTGENSGDYAGFAVAGVGDVDGAGKPDIIIGSYGNPDGGSSAGKIYWIDGEGYANGTHSLSSIDVTFTGEDTGDGAGKTVAAAGDVDGDGYADFLVSAPLHDYHAKLSIGKVYLIYGSPIDFVGAHSYLLSDVGGTVVGATFEGDAQGDHLGTSMSGMGNITGADTDDFVLAAYSSDTNGSNSGKFYVFAGSTTRVTGAVSLSSAAANYYGEATNNYAGYAMSAAGDLNDDGAQDFIVSAYGNADVASYAGKTYVILGSLSGLTGSNNLSSTENSLLGENSSDYSGYSIAAGGNIDGAGHEDILIGAYLADDEGVNRGRVYVLLIP